MINKYAAVIKLSDGDAALATWDGKLIVGNRRDVHKLFGNLIVQLVPIGDETTVAQIGVREHCPEMFNKEVLFQGGKLHGTYQDLKYHPTDMRKGDELYTRDFNATSRVVYRYSGDVK